MRTPSPCLLAILAALFVSACGEEDKRELCNDSLDNDRNGLIDCEDPTCLHTGGCDFAPCVTGNECQGDLCLTEPDNGFPEGACSTFCDLDAPDCPFGPDSVCVDIDLDDGRGICVDACSTSDECRETLNCRDGNVGVLFCLPDCASDADCPITGHCNRDNGFCESTPEVCDNVIDDDLDSRSDCDDFDCQTDEACNPVIACQTAPIVIAGTVNDNTENGINIFAGSCAGGSARERIFSFIPTNQAALRATLSSPTVQGVYAFIDCQGFKTDCANTFSQDPAELIIPEPDVVVGVPVLFVVDGFLSGQEGPFSLTIEEVAPESNCEDLFDEDFDGAVDCQDSNCQAECTPGNGPLGAPCTAPSDCQLTSGSPACFDEVLQGFPSGYCTGFCFNDAQCGAGDLCRGGFCFLGCADSAECATPGYECVLVGGDSFCAPRCSNDAQCAEAGFCDSDLGLCKQVTEDCDNFIDDDGDNLEDCQDLVCQQTVLSCDESQNCNDGQDNEADQLIDCEDVESCGASADCQLAGLCAGASPLAGSFAGDTANGSQQFSGSCTGANLSRESIFTVTPGVLGQVGTFTLTLDSETDQGFYLRTTCEDPATEVACEDARVGGQQEGLVLTGVPGELSLTIFVDGFQDPNEAGPFTLTVLYTPQ